MAIQGESKCFLCNEEFLGNQSGIFTLKKHLKTLKNLLVTQGEFKCFQCLDNSGKTFFYPWEFLGNGGGNLTV